MPGYLDDRSLAEQFVTGGPRIPTVGELAKSSAFSLTVDQTEVLRTDPPQPAVVLGATRLPSAAELSRELATLPAIDGNKPVRDRLRSAYQAVVALDQARAAAAAATSDAGRAAARQRVLELTETARRLLGVEIGGIRFGRVTGQLDPATGALTATVHDTEITGIAGPGFGIEKLTGSLELRLSAGG